MSRFFTSSALSSMNLRRGSTWSPISVVNIRSAAGWSSALTCSSVRLVGIHRGLPQRVRVHLAEAFVAVDRDALFAGGDEELDQVVERVDLDLLVLGHRRLAAPLGPSAPPRAWSPRRSGAPPIVVSSAAACAALLGRRVVRRAVDAGAGRLDDHRRLDVLDVVVAVRQRAELGRQHEVEIDAVVLAGTRRCDPRSRCRTPGALRRAARLPRGSWC